MGMEIAEPRRLRRRIIGEMMRTGRDTRRRQGMHRHPLVVREITEIAPRPPRLPYLPGLDGLRAIAVAAVLLYHASVGWLPGGFLGVEIFFVISGYLITSLLLREQTWQGTIDLRGFWFRRARRLLPALYALLIVVLAYAVIRLPEEVTRLRQDALAAFGYVTNWYLIFRQQSYFETVGRPSLLQHLWSLAVEEQFYLLWPPLLLLLLRFLRRRTVFLVALAGAIGSAALMAILYHPEIDPSRVYYGTDTRAAGLLIGAALAFVWVPGGMGRWQMQSTLQRLGIAPLLFDVAGVAALIGIGTFLVGVNEYQPFLYRGGFLVLDLCTVILIAVLVHPRAHLGPYVFGIAPLRWAGTRSYSIYLWHWPVFMLTRPQLDIRLDGWPLLALRLAITGILAEASYRFVETPFRTGALGRAWRAHRETRGAARWRLRARWTTAAATGAGLMTALSLAVASAHPPAVPDYLAVTAVRILPPTHTPAALGGTPAILPDTTGTPVLTLPRATTTVARPVASSTATPTTAPIVAPSPALLATRLEIAHATAPPEPPPPPEPRTLPRVTAIGDSVMLGAARELARVIPDLDLDAAVSRHTNEAVDLLRAKRDAGELGDVVVIHMGTNGVFTPDQFDAIMAEVKDVPRVIFLNLRVPRQWEDADNAAIADGVRRYPNAVLLDWHAATDDRPDLFVSDGIHLQPVGQRLYAQLVLAYLRPTIPEARE